MHCRIFPPFMFGCTNARTDVFLTLQARSSQSLARFHAFTLSQFDCIYTKGIAAPTCTHARLSFAAFFDRYAPHIGILVRKPFAPNLHSPLPHLSFPLISSLPHVSPPSRFRSPHLPLTRPTSLPHRHPLRPGARTC